MKTIHVVAALIRNGDKIFATQRGYGAFQGGWEFPGGKIAEGESPQQALVREIQEELNTTITVGKLFTIVEHDYPDFHLSMRCYWCKVVEGDLELKEHMNACWLGQDELDTVDWLPADQTIIGQIKEEGFVIKNLVFDVGHVLLSYRWHEMFLEHGLSPEEANRIGDQIFDQSVWTEKFDRGIINEKELVAEYSQRYPKDQEHIAWFIEHGEEMPVDRQGIWDQVMRLKETGYRIYILSNYSDYLFNLHTKRIPFMKDLDGMVVSYEPHLIKPDAEIYQYLFAKYDLKAKECLFFDDKYPNVIGSHDVGMDAIHVTSEEMLYQTLNHME